MNDDGREIHSAGMGAQNGKGEIRLVDTCAPQGNRTESRANTVGEESQQGYIYFIETEDGRFVKIGFSTNVVQRLGNLGTIMPVRLLGSLPGTRHTEAWIHKKFAKDWKLGEWFHPSEQLRQFIAIAAMSSEEAKQAEIAVQKKPVVPVAVMFEQHYTAAELAKAWHMAPETVRAWFDNEPGGVRQYFPLRKGKKRSYTTLRIPESVARRVYERKTNRRS